MNVHLSVCMYVVCVCVFIIYILILFVYSSENVSASLCARFSSCVGTAGWPKSLD